MRLLSMLIYFYVAELLTIYAHEVGHWLAAQACGIRVAQPQVLFQHGFPVGGHVRLLDAEVRVSVGVAILLFGAGPLVNLLGLAVAACYLLVGGAWSAFAWAFVGVNAGSLLMGALGSDDPNSDFGALRVLFQGRVTMRPKRSVP